MTRAAFTFVFALFALLTPARAEIQIVTTLPDLAALAREVGGAHVHVTALTPPGQDPHYTDPRPNLILPLARADLLIVNGLELEVGWLPPLQVAARNARIQTGAEGYFDASTVVTRLAIPHGPIDRAMGDIHPGGNPHYTFDPRAARPITAAIATHLARLDPKNATHYQARARAYDDRLATFAAAQTARFASLPPARRRVITYHPSLTYLLDWLTLTQAITLEPRPGIAPTPAHVARVLEVIRREGIRVIVQESYYPRKTSDTLARLAGAEVIVLPGGTPDGTDYLTHLTHISDALHAALAK